MTAEKVLIFPSPKGNVSENNIKQVETHLDRFGIRHERYSAEAEHDFDAVIALGGDGTMLNAARLAFRREKPIMCINFGTLGYMSGLENSELDMLESLVSGFDIENRMLLDVRVERNGETVAGCTALNEAVIARKADGDIAMLELRCDGALVCDYRADGIIIATPTGSSAYAMSAGGPIIDTKLEAVCVCPICPHSLGTKAMVFSPNSRLEAVSMNTEERENNLLIADGRAIAELQCGDKVCATRSEKTLGLIKLKKDAFYETLYNKMS